MNGERTETDDDNALVARFLRGDAAAFDSLFVKYQDYVVNIIYGIVGAREEARDLAQDVFVQVYRSLPRFRRDARFATWLYRVAVNRAVDAARSPKRWRFLPILDVPALANRAADSEGEPEQVLVRNHERSVVQATLMLCPLSHRETLVLRYYQGLTLEEIAETLGCSVPAAKVRLHRARKVFKENYIATQGVEFEEACQPGDPGAAEPAR